MDKIGAVFQPELIELMKAVLDDATVMLPEAKRTSAMKAEIASQILACAAKGERNAATLKTAALGLFLMYLVCFINRFITYHRQVKEGIQPSAMLCVTSVTILRFHSSTRIS